MRGVLTTPVLAGAGELIRPPASARPRAAMMAAGRIADLTGRAAQTGPHHKQTGGGNAGNGPRRSGRRRPAAKPAEGASQPQAISIISGMEG